MAGRHTYISKGAISKIVGDAYEVGMRDLVEELASLGYQAILWAYQHRGFKNDTKNLYESYASAVYVKGRYVEGSMRFITGGTGDNTGRQDAEAYLRNPRVNMKGSDVAILCIAAAPYAEYLESGSYNLARRFKDADGEWHSVAGEPYRPLGRKIQVISAAEDFLLANRGYIKSRYKNLFKVRGYKVIGGE